MAVLTLAEFKLTAPYLLNTSLFSDDTITQALLNDAEDMYLTVRGKPFKEITGDTTNLAYTIDSVTDADVTGLEKGFFIRGASIAGNVTDIATDNELTLDAAATATTADEDMFAYPVGAQSVVASITLYLREDAGNNSTHKSEAIEKHSWANLDQMDTAYGLPKKITSRIKSYARMPEGTITGKGYYKGREEISTSDIDYVVERTTE